MPLDIGLLPSAALTGLTEDQQGELQKQATTQFLLGTLLSGDPSMGYKGAMGLPEQAMAAQTQRTALEKAQRDQAEINAFRSQFMPSKTDAAGRAMAGGGGPTNAAAQAQTDILNAPLDIDAAQRAALGLVGNTYQPRIVESLKNMQNTFQPELGAFLTPGKKIVGTVPIADKSGMTKQYDQATGQWKYGTGVGAVDAVSALTGAETRAREMNTMRDTTLPSGEKQQVFPNAGAGGTGIVTALPTAITALNEQYKPILADAYAGYQTAKKTNPVIDQLQNAFNDPNFDTGSFTNLRTQLGTALQSIGVTGDRNKQFLTNAISARQGLNALTGESLTEAKGAISNFEIGYYGQRNAQITDPKESTNFNLAVLREANKRKEDFYKFVADPKNAGGDVLQKWESSPQGSKSMFESTNLRKYLPQQKIESGEYKGMTKHQLPNGKWVIFQ